MKVSQPLRTVPHVRSDYQRALARFQRQQLGLVTIAQAAQAGVAADVLYRAARAGALHHVRRGVFASAAAPISWEQQLLATLLALNAKGWAVASHTSCARLLDLRLPPTKGHKAKFEITTGLTRRAQLANVYVHRSGLMTEADVQHSRGIPHTSATRFLVDMSTRVNQGELGILIDEALRRRLTSLGLLQRTAMRLRSAPGRSQLRILTAIRERSGEEESESLLEGFTLAALDRFGVRRPVAQHVVEINGKQRRVDFAYPDKLRAVEALGFEYHGARSRFDQDAVRGNELVLAGYVPMYVTSAMTDWDIAALVAEGIGDRVPPATLRPQSFADWKRRRYRAA